MIITLTRSIFRPDRTLGQLAINGKHFCYTLEDTVRETKIPGETAIPEGTYRIAVTYSPKYKRLMPEVLNVPGFEGVRIHGGNNPSHTEGCILVAYMRDEETGIIFQSASTDFLHRVQANGGLATLIIGGNQ